MSHSFDILFDSDRGDPQRAFDASIVLTPVDDFDGSIVTGPVRAEMPGFGKVAKRSLSGHLVFERLAATKPGQGYRVTIDPERAGYFSPDDREVPVPQPRAGLGQISGGDTRIVRLIRMPDFVADGEAMVLRGAVVNAAGEPVEGVVLTAEVGIAVDPADPDPPQPADQNSPLPVFTTRTNAKGNFAIRMRPPVVSLANTPRLPITGNVSLRIGSAGKWAGKIRDLSTWIGYGEPARLERVVTGTISEMSVSFGSGGAPQVEISGYDKLFGMMIGKVTDYLENEPDSAFVRKIASRHGLIPDIVDTMPVKPRIEQNEETDLAFLEKLAERNKNYTFYVVDKNFYFGPRHHQREAEITLPWGAGLTSFSPEVNLAKQIVAVEVVGTSAEGAQIIGRAGKGQEAGRDAGDRSGPELLAEAMNEEPVLRIRAGIHTQDEAKAKAEAILNERAKKFLTGSAECIGLPELRPDLNVAFKGLGKGFSKTYWISAAVILPVLTGRRSRLQAAIFSFWAGVMPPIPMLGRSLL